LQKQLTDQTDPTRRDEKKEKEKRIKKLPLQNFFCQCTNKEREEAEREIKKKRRKIEKIGKEF